MTFEEMAKTRYSVKKYDGKPVEEEKLNRILQTALLAPTAKDSQAFRIYVLKSSDALEKVKNLTPCTYGAPVVLLFTYEDTESYEYPETPGSTSGPEDCSIVATHVMFAALEQGLGTCWVNRFTPKAAAEAFHLPATEHPVLFMDLGYAAADAKPLPPHTKKRPASELIREL